MKLHNFTLRIDELDMRIFKHEAMKQRMTLSDYMRNLVRHGYFYQGIRNVVSELQTAIPQDKEQKQVFFETIFEIRNNLRIMALKENKEYVDEAKRKAIETAKNILNPDA